MTDDNAIKDSALVDAVTSGLTRVVDGLLKMGANPNMRNGKNEPVLSLAAANNHPDIITLLLDHHADIEAVGGLGNTITALGEATYAGKVEAARVLIDRNADVNHRSGDMTPVGWASAQRGNVEIVRMLIAHGADVNTPGSCHMTPIIEAAVYGQEDIAEELIRHGANVNAIGNLGGTALKWASHHDYPGIVQMLVDHGADVDAKDSNGDTPMMAAEKRQSRASIAVLRRVFDARACRALEEAEDKLCTLAESSKALDHDVTVRGPIRFRRGFTFA